MSEERKHYRQLYVQVSAGEVYAFIPGNIMEIFVKKGQKVKKGDALLSLHAMKMDNNICANVDGKIEKINVKKGQAVSKNDVLINIIPDAAE
ncbi:MAG: biotin/lipoyl-binding protein [Bacteroidales bacterium]|nr:biotin/lipoyl-binding protein [Bacteroidales bacterium]